MSDRGMAVRLVVLNITFFLGLGIALPFLPIWLNAKGMGAGEIATLLAAQSAIRVVASAVLTNLADYRRDRRGVVVWCCIATFVASIWLALSEGFWPILIALTCAYAAFAPILPILEATAVNLSQRHGFDYGRIRVWGSLSFVAGSAGAGAVLGLVNGANLIWLLVAAHGLMAASALLMPRDDAAIAGARARQVSRITARALGLLLGNPWFVVFILAAGFTQASHALYYSFGSIHWQHLEISTSMIGVLWALGVMAEIILFQFSGRVSRVVAPALLLVAGAVAGLVRWSVMAFDPGLEWLFLLQCLHAFTFGATHLGTMFFIRDWVMKDITATAQGLYAAVSGGIMMTVLILASGPLYAAFSASAYLVMSLCCLVSLAAGVLLWAVNPKAQTVAGAWLRP